MHIKKNAGEYKNLRLNSTFIIYPSQNMCVIYYLKSKEYSNLLSLKGKKKK